MLADIISVGDEILIGQIVNTNSSWIAQQLNSIGVKVNRIVTVGDTFEEILAILKESGARSKIVLITGGLGPTSDDITKPALCQYFNTTLRFDEKVFEMVDSFISKRGGFMNELNRAQANVPVSAEVIYNTIGTAPGLWFENDGVVYISMPGVPFEMENLMLTEVLPRIKNKFRLGKIFHKTVLTTGIPESKLALQIESWEKQLPDNFKLAYLPSPGMVRLRLSSFDDENVSEKADKEIEKLKSILSDAIYGYDNDTLESVVGNILKERKKTISTAESCTGGNIAKLITSISGSSDYFNGSIVAYSNEVKSSHLQVPAEVITKFGAVSKEVVEIMAKKCLESLHTDYAISISGIAGPTGGSAEKPVGTVWIAVASKTKVISEKFNFGDERSRNITRASYTALNMIRKFILEGN